MGKIQNFMINTTKFQHEYFPTEAIGKYSMRGGRIKQKLAFRHGHFSTFFGSLFFIVFPFFT